MSQTSLYLIFALLICCDTHQHEEYKLFTGAVTPPALPLRHVLGPLPKHHMLLKRLRGIASPACWCL
jgi:hypothetical protein